MSEQRRSRFDLVCFDWDGTLYDSTAVIARCMREAVVDLGGTPPRMEVATSVIGLSLQQALARAAPDIAPARYPELGARYRHHYFQRQHDIQLFDGVLAMLAELRERRHLLAVATGKSRQGLNLALQAAELQGLFDGSRTADETAGKPNPQMLRELMGEFGVDPARTLMIGDTTHDLQMAVNAGCASVAVSYGAHEEAELVALGPRHIARSVAQLRDWLRVHG